MKKVGTPFLPGAQHLAYPRWGAGGKEGGGGGLKPKKHPPTNPCNTMCKHGN